MARDDGLGIGQPTRPVPESGYRFSSGWLRSRLPRWLLLDAGLVLLVLALLWGTIAANLARIRAEAEQDVVHDTRNLVHVFQESVGHTIGSIDRVILLLRAAYARDPADFDLTGWARQIRMLDPLVLRVFIRDAAGRIVTSDPALPGQSGPATAAPTGDDLIVSPETGRDGDRVVLLARKVLSPDGSVLGFVGASVDSSRLVHRYGSREAGEEELLVGLDGTIRASTETSGAIAAGRSLADTDLPRRATQEAEGSFISSGALTGMVRIVSFGRVASYPLFVVATAGKNAVLAPYRQVRDRYFAAGAVLSALLLLLGILLIGHKRQLLRSRAALSDALENISQGIILIDRNRRVPVINRRCIELLELPAELLANNPSFDDLLRWQTAAGEFVGTDEAFLRSVRMGGLPPVASVYERVRANGTVLEVRTHMLPDGGAVRTFTDITERRRADERIRHLAHHDALTGLANRVAFAEQLAAAIATAGPGGSRLAVLCLDLDGFKQVNDLHGHAAGDDLLVQVAARMRSTLRSDDLAGRMGGDELAIMQTASDQPAAAAVLADTLVTLLGEPYRIDGSVSQIGVSIGIAWYPADGRSGEELLRNADMALYHAKKSGRGTFCFFKPDMAAAHARSRARATE